MTSQMTVGVIDDVIYDGWRFLMTSKMTVGEFWSPRELLMLQSLQKVHSSYRINWFSCFDFATMMSSCWHVKYFCGKNGPLSLKTNNLHRGFEMAIINAYLLLYFIYGWDVHRSTTKVLQFEGRRVLSLSMKMERDPIDAIWGGETTQEIITEEKVHEWILLRLRHIYLIKS